MGEEKKKGFFENVWTSIRDFEKYGEFAANKVSSAIKYILMVTLIFTLIISLAYTCKFYTILTSAKEYIGKNIDEIKLQDGKLEVLSNGPIIIENEKNIIPIIIIDTSENANKKEYLEKIKRYNTGLLALNDKVIISSSLLSKEEEIHYVDMFSSNIENKQEFIGFISGTNVIYAYVLFGITILIYMFIIYITSNLVDGIVLGILGYIFARIVRLRLRFKATFNIGLHALTLPITLNLIYIVVNTFTNYQITYFQWMYTTISYIYVAVAILMIKTEIINQKMQLRKLNEIQGKISDYEIKEEEQKEKEKDKKQDDKEEEENQGEEPEGSNA